MKSLLFALVAGLFIASCQVPVEKQYFSESSDIDLGKKLLKAYLAQDWDAYPELYADTARIWRNKNWTKDEGFTVQQYVEDLKEGGDHDAFLAFFEAPGSECSLDDELIRAPKIKVVKEHSGEEDGERNSVRLVADGV